MYLLQKAWQRYFIEHTVVEDYNLDLEKNNAWIVINMIDPYNIESLLYIPLGVFRNTWNTWSRSDILCSRYVEWFRVSEENIGVFISDLNMTWDRSEIHRSP